MAHTRTAAKSTKDVDLDGKAIKDPQSLAITLNNNPEMIMKGTHIISVPKWSSTSPAPTDTSDSSTMPPEIRALTLGLVGTIIETKNGDDFNGGIVSETIEYPYTPASNKKFAFFNQTDLPATAFLTHVVRGEMKEAKAMLDKNPSLVLYKGQVIDYSGRTIEGTAYQIALGGGDVNRAKLDNENKPILDAEGHIKILHPNEGMAEMISSYFKGAFNGDDKAANKEIREQQEAQFPGGYDQYQKSEQVKQQKADDLKALNDVIHAIAIADVKFTNGTYDNSNNGETKIDENCEKALDKFRQYLQPKGVIKKGEHFNVELLVEAFRQYEDATRWNQFGGWDSPKNVLMWRKVIGYIQRYLPASYAQAFCQSLYDVVDSGQKLERCFIFRYSPTYKFYPLDSNLLSRLGYKWACTGDCVATWETVFAESRAGWDAPLPNLCRAKTAVFREHMQHPEDKSKKTWCVIM